MEVAGLSLPLVFAAGIVSFISPCVLPLVPGYVTAVSGVSFAAIARREQGVTRQVMLASGLFFAGFLLVFAALGASASVIGSLLSNHRLWLDRGAGALIVLFGLAMLGAGWSGALPTRWTGTVQRLAKARGGPLALGVAFAFCWTPCVGPILASILVLAARSSSLPSGVSLLVIYGLGLAVPFLLVGVSFARALAVFKRMQAHYRAIQLAAGLLLVTMGTLFLSGELYRLNSYAQRALSALGLEWWAGL